MGRSSADAARTLASGFATCSGDAYEMGDVIGVGGFGRCVVVLRASSSTLDVCSRRVPARLPASRLTLASSLVASSSRSVRACRRRDDAAPSPRPLAVKAVRLAPSPRDVRSAGAESSAGPRPPNPAERLAAEIDALRRVASTASDSPRARLFTALVDVFLLDDVAHLVLTRLAATDRDLSRVLDDAPDRRLPESRARRYAAQIALALDHIHRAAKLVHLDLKPENVLVDDRDEPGRVAVCDFDLARPVAASSSSNASDIVVGTEEYLAPETIDGERPGPAADWWAFAVLLYEMTHGETPFRSRFGFRERTFERIRRAPVAFPKTTDGRHVTSDACRWLIVAMTRRPGGPDVRLGGKEGLREISSAPFWDGADWETE